MPSPIRILVVDDHPALRLGMKAVVRVMRDEATLVGLASDGGEAIDKYRALRPDVVTLDLRMPKMDGLLVIERLLGLDPGAKILVMTLYDSEEDVYRSFEAGACGYILKSASRQEITEAIRCVSRGERYLPAHLAEKIASRASTATLTPRETEVLSLMRLGITNKEIAESLNIGAGTVKTHVREILEKLGAMSRTEAIAIAHHRGLLK